MGSGEGLPYLADCFLADEKNGEIKIDTLDFHPKSLLKMIRLDLDPRFGKLLSFTVCISPSTYLWPTFTFHSRSDFVRFEETVELSSLNTKYLSCSCFIISGCGKCLNNVFSDDLV